MTNAKRLEADENLLIDLIDRNGEAWLADMLDSALQVRADGFAGPEWRRLRLLGWAKEVAALKQKILAEDAACKEENRATGSAT